MTQLDQMSQSNAALVEEGAAAAESLKDQAVKLHKLVSRYRVAGVVAKRAAPASSPVSSGAKAPAPAARPAPARAPAPRPAAKAAPAPSSTPAPAPKESNDGDWETF